MFTGPLGRLEAVTAHMEVSWMGCIAGAQALIVGSTSPVHCLSCDPDVAHAPGGSGGSLVCGGSTGLGAGGYPVPHQCSM